MKKIFTLLFICASFLITGEAFSQSEYRGTVRYIDDARTPVASVTVKLYDAFGNLVATDKTNGQGKYKFTNLPDGNYTVKFSGHIQGAKYDLRNANLISKNLWGYVQLTPLQKLAADVNGNGRVDWGDVYTLAVDYFLFGKRGSVGKLVALPKQIQIGGYSLKGSGDDDDIGGSGDPDGVFLPTTKARVENFEIKYLKGLNVQANESIEVPVYFNANAKLNGFAVSMNYAKTAMDFEQLNSNIDGIEFSNANGIIKATWQNNSGITNIDVSKPLFTLKFSTANANDIKGLKGITFNQETQFIDANGSLIEDAQLSLPNLIGMDGANTLNNIYPNPIFNTAKINYSLSGNYKVNLNIYNTVGQLVTTLVNKEQAAGTYEVEFNRANLHLSAGSYIYRLECKGENPFVQSKIMIIR